MSYEPSGTSMEDLYKKIFKLNLSKLEFIYETINVNISNLEDEEFRLFLVDLELFRNIAAGNPNVPQTPYHIFGFTILSAHLDLSFIFKRNPRLVKAYQDEYPNFPDLNGHQILALKSFFENLENNKEADDAYEIFDKLNYLV
jgi:hypothetical protein